MTAQLDAEYQESDVLNLSAEKWCELLEHAEIFDDNLIKLIIYVYRQPNHESTATDIGAYFGTNYHAVTRWYVEASKKIYQYCGKEPQIGSGGHKRFWNTLFVQLEDQKSKRIKPNGKLLYRLVLRPNLAAAMERSHLV